MYQKFLDCSAELVASRPVTLMAHKLIPMFIVVMLIAAAAQRTLAQQVTPSPDPTDMKQLQVPSIAPDYRGQQRSLPELSRVGVDVARQHPLALREALSMALENNKDIEVARDNVKIAEFDLLGAHGAYDPRFNSTAFYERIKSPISSFLSGGQNGSIVQSDYTGTARLEGLSPKLGGTYHFDFSSVRLTTNNSFTALNPQYPSSLTFSYTQPLVRGFRFDNARRQIEIAKKNLSLSDAQFRQRAIETITNVQRAYWDLVFALRSLQVQRDAVTVAKTQLEHNRRLVNEGQLAPIDLVASESQITTYEQGVFSALEDVTRYENTLKNLVAKDHVAEIWADSIVPTDSVDLSVPQVSLVDALKTAVDNRPELQQSEVLRQINEIDQRYYKDQAKPAIDLVGTYGSTGLAGSVASTGVNPFTASSQLVRDRIDQLSILAGLQPLPVTPPTTFSPNLVGSYDKSLENLLAQRYNTFKVGVQINFPLRNRTAEAQLGRSLVEGERIATQREQVQQTIQVEVRNALQSVRSAESRLRAAVSTREMNEQQFSSEQRKLDAGQSTVFLVLERQTELTTAKGMELKAQTDLNKSIADLQKAIGSSLNVNSIVVRVR
jgi:outer membrane protein